MNSNTCISFIVPVYNGGQTLEESLNSIVNGNISDLDEIIIVDNASTDNSSLLIKNYCERYSFIHCIRHNINKGSAAMGRIDGIEIANNA